MNAVFPFPSVIPVLVVVFAVATMLETAVNKEFNQLGITGVDPMSLDLAQLSTIKGVIGSSDYNRSEKKSQIEAIIANN